MHLRLSLQVAQQKIGEEHPHHTSAVCPISLQTIGEPPCGTVDVVLHSHLYVRHRNICDTVASPSIVNAAFHYCLPHFEILGGRGLFFLTFTHIIKEAVTPETKFKP